MKKLILCPNVECGNHLPDPLHPKYSASRFTRLKNCCGLKMYECRLCGCWFSFNDKSGIVPAKSRSANKKEMMEMKIGRFMVSMEEV